MRGVRSTLITSASNHTTSARARVERRRPRGREGQRARQEVHAEVEPGAGGDQLLDLGVGLGARRAAGRARRTRARAPAGPSARPISPATSSAASAFGPWPGAAELDARRARRRRPRRARAATRPRAGASRSGWRSTVRSMAGMMPRRCRRRCGSRPTELVERARMTRFMRERRLRRATTSCGAGRSTTSRASGRRSGTTSTSAARYEPRARRRARCRARSGSRARSVNYAEHVFRGKRRRRASRSSTRPSCASSAEVTWGELRAQVARIARRAAGAAASSAATAWSPTCRTSPRRSPRSWPPPSLGAVWSRLLARVRRAQRDRPLRPDRAEGAAGGRRLPLRRPGLRPRARPSRRSPARCGARASCGSATSTAAGWEDGFLGRDDAPLEFARVPFDHPLWVLYSSGTTGLPKAIVQGQGGILLEHLKMLHLHVDAQAGDRLFWFTTTGWMMWNFLVSGAAHRGGGRALRRQPRPPGPGRAVGPRRRGRHDHASARAPATSPRCMKAGVEPARRPRPVEAARGRLDRLAAVARGLPLDLRARRRRTPGCSRPAAAPTCARRSSAAARSLPVYEGELQARALGATVEAWDPEGRAADRRGRRARDHRADALDAALLLGRPGRRALPRGLLRHLPGRLAPRRLDRDHRARHGDHLRAARTRRSTAAASAWARPRSTARCSRVDEVVDALVVDVPRDGEELDAAVRRAARRAPSSTTT